MLDLERFNRQAEKLALDIHLITSRHAEQLKELYHNAAAQICELAHDDTRPVLYMNHRAPADVASEIWAAYEHQFSYLLEQKEPFDEVTKKAPQLAKG